MLPPAVPLWTVPELLMEWALAAIPKASYLVHCDYDFMYPDGSKDGDCGLVCGFCMPSHWESPNARACCHKGGTAAHLAATQRF